MTEDPATHKDQLLHLWQSVAEVAGGRVPDTSMAVELGSSLLVDVGDVFADESVPMGKFVTALEANLAASDRALSPLIRIRLLFAMRWFDSYLDAMRVAPELLDSLCALRQPFVQYALIDELLFVERDHPFGLLLQLLSMQAPTWYAGQGRAAEKFKSSLEALIQSLSAELVRWSASVHDGCIDGIEVSLASLSASVAIADFMAFMNKESARAELQRERCIEREKSELQLARLKLVVNQHYTSQLEGEKLPEFVVNFIVQKLIAELQFILINHTEKHESWQLWKRLFILLARIYSEDVTRKPQIVQMVQEAVSLLEPELSVHALSQLAYDEFVQELTASMFSLLSGVAVVCIEAVPLRVDASNMGALTQVSRALLKQVAVIREGDWFLLESETDDVIRCQLLLKLIDVQSMIFVNRAGIKVAKKTVEEFAFCLSSRIAVPLKIESIFESCSVRAINTLRELYDQNLEGYRAEQQHLEELKLEQAVARQAEILLRQQAAVKARAEAEKLAEHERLQRIAQAAELKLVRQQKQAEILRAVDALKVGAWLELPIKDGALVKAKLAVTIPSTGKHIFVDCLGLKLAELKRPQLIEALLQDGARIISEGDSFESQLSRVVKGLRRGVNG